MAEDASSAGAPRSAQVFLSYARTDRVRAAKLAGALSAAGLTVWWDAMISGGAAFVDTIEEALTEADAVIVLWSRASVVSNWVRDEAAQGRDRQCLVPVSLDGSEAPLGFRQYHAIDLSTWRGRRDAPQIKAIIDAVAGTIAHPIPGVPSTRTLAMPSRRSMLAVIGGGGVAAVGAGGYIGWRRGLFGAGPPDNSIAILPFKNLSGDPAQAYFSDGLTEEIRAALSRINALKVMADTSSALAGASSGDATKVAQKLAVAFVLDGAVRRNGDMVRISTTLTDGKTGFTRWSQTFDRKLADIFAVESEIAGIVAEQLALQVATADPAPGGTSVVAAYEAYLRGRAFFNAAKDEATDRAALEQFDLAIAADPNFALAHAARSRSLAAIAAEYAKASDLQPLYNSAIAAAERSVAIAPDVAEGQLALGYAIFIGRLDIVGARPAYDRAYALGHGNADILLLFALYVVRAPGRGGEALAAITRALALDPLNPRTQRAAGSINYALRRYAPAMRYLNRAIALNPNLSNAQSLIGNCQYLRGRFREARAAYAAETHAIFRLSGLAIVDHRLGDAAAAKASLAELISGSGDSALYQQAEVLAQWGDLAGAIAALERARAVGDSGLLYLATDPMLDPLAVQPRFKALLQTMHLS